MFDIRPETPEDEYEVEILLDLAFAPGRTGLSSYRLRDGVARIRDLCLTARDEYGSATAAIRYWPIRIGEAACGGAGWPALLLGPIAVHPTRQGEGVGALLMRESLAKAADLGWRRVVLIGDEPYYRRFGFERRLGETLDFPPPVNPNRLLARALIPSGMDAVAGMVRKWTA